MASFVMLLSQYGILRSVAENLTTVDLLNLARVCKGAWEYTHINAGTFNTLKSLTLCDAQARVRKKWVLNILQLPPESPDCLGTSSKACVRCSVNICDNCRARIKTEEPHHDRFRIDYPLGVSPYKVTVYDVLRSTTVSVPQPKARRPYDTWEPVPFSERKRYYCSRAECSASIKTSLESRAEPLCKCESGTPLRYHPDTSAWICIPCFIAEEEELWEVYRNHREPRYRDPGCFPSASTPDIGDSLCYDRVTNVLNKIMGRSTCAFINKCHSCGDQVGCFCTILCAWCGGRIPKEE